MYLYGTRRQDKPGKHWLWRNISVRDLKILGDKLTEQVELMKAGDKVALGKVIESHGRLAIHIAQQYAATTRSGLVDELVSEALLAVVIACNRVTFEFQDSITTYIAKEIHGRCGRVVAEDCLIRIPNSTACEHRRKGIEVHYPSIDDIDKFVAYGDEENPNEPADTIDISCELEESIRSCILTRMEKIIVDRSILGDNDRHIAEMLGRSVESVNKARNALRERFELRERIGNADD